MKTQKLVYPQEVEVLYMLPAIRREFAHYFKSIGLEQKEIARLLKVSEPSVSHYLKAKRATQVTFSDKDKGEIAKSAENLRQNKSLVDETARLLYLLKESRVTCKVCIGVTDTPKDCNACFHDHRQAA
ncbi:hypothetical protein HY639_05390 [Candidatus Woesearchaeota archaeon]|nr:hypothetical protein [Candidatus Woesearchaeota archaeon]